MRALNPLKKSKELDLVAEINQRLNPLAGIRDGSIKPPELESVVKPFHKSMQNFYFFISLIKTMSQNKAVLEIFFCLPVIFHTPKT